MPSLLDFKRLSPHLDSALSLYETGAVPQSLFLYGPQGVGKRTLARLLSMLILCSGDTDQKPCGQCDPCRKVAAGVHSNLLVVSPPGQSAIKIDDMRGVLGALSQHGLEQGRRVVVIEDAHRLTPQAQNALLKSLEEPDSYTHFILTASSARSVLPTILSRTAKLFVPPWEDRYLLPLLAGQGVEESEARQLAGLSHGSPGAALMALQDDTLKDTMAVVEKTFLALRSQQDIPAASAALKNMKDNADLLLECLETFFSRKLSLVSTQGQYRALEKMLASVARARRYKAANVTWQSIADQLLFETLEDFHACQW